MSTAKNTGVMRPKRSLLRHLLAWSLAALVVVWGSFILFGLRTGVHEADELTDGHLASVAALLLSEHDGHFEEKRDVGATVPADLKRHDYQQSMSVVVWDRSGKVITHSGEAPLPPFTPDEGFADLRLGDPIEHWRSFSQWNGPQHERKVTVLLSVKERDELAWDIAEQMAEPGLWLLPAIALALGLAIRRGLTPLYELSQDVQELDVTRGEPLKNRHPHAEFASVVRSINELVERQHAVLARERQLASELAHELRTPLAALALHARTLRGPTDPGERERALERIEHDALRAGHVLSQLLARQRDRPHAPRHAGRGTARRGRALAAGLRQRRVAAHRAGRRSQRWDRASAADARPRARPPRRREDRCDPPRTLRHCAAAGRLHVLLSAELRAGRVNIPCPFPPRGGGSGRIRRR